VTTLELMSAVAVCLALLIGLSSAWLLVILHQRSVLKSAGGLAVTVRRGQARWSIGVGRYAGDEFLWYRTWTFSPAPALRMPRAELTVLETATWESYGDPELRPNSMVVRCRFRGEQVSLGLPDGALTGFLSWLEASAPRF
jgi:hypothetical protein